MSIILQAAAKMELDAGVQALLRPEMSPVEAVSALLASGAHGDALKLVARLLPRRFVVAWVCQCARGETLTLEARAGASLAEKWARDPSEENRRAAFEFARAGEYKTLGAWIAATAGWAAGSLGPADLNVAIPPPDHLTAVAATAAINMMSVLDMVKFDERRLGFVKRALDLLTQATANNGAAKKQA